MKPSEIKVGKWYCGPMPELGYTREVLNIYGRKKRVDWKRFKDGKHDGCCGTNTIEQFASWAREEVK